MKTLRSLSFRLVLLYLAFFIGSVGIVGGLYYWVEIERPVSAMRGEIEAEVGELRGVYRVRGEEGLALALESRAGDTAPRIGFHALVDARGQTVTANLPSWPAAYAPGWKRLEADFAQEGDEDEHEALVLDMKLPGGERLLVGRDIEDIDALEESIRHTLIWVIPALLALGLIGGAILSRAIGTRIDGISRAALAVIDGEFSSRIALRGTSDDFDRLAATLNDMLDRLERALEAVRRVSDSVAHELRTPLARLQASLGELQEQPTTESAQSALAEARRLGSVIDAVLRISRIEAARHRMEYQAVDLSALLEDAAEFYSPEAEARAQIFEVRIDGGLRVSGDRDLLFQGVANLLDNALKFTPEGGRISLSAARDGAWVLIEVRDDGPGIPEDALGRVTERFFRVDDTAAVPGLGLGLPLVAAIAEAHRSSLEFASAQPGLLVRWRLKPGPAA